jgi:hypothetical protein
MLAVENLPQLTARFDLSRLATRYPLDDVTRALTKVAGGSVMKAVLVSDGTD